MTMNQAAALRGKWNQPPDRTPCEHSNLKLEWNERGYSMGLPAFSAVNRLPRGT